MGRSKRGKRHTKPAKDEEDRSADEGPDPESDEFFHDSIDKFNMTREKILLDTEADESEGENSFEEVEDVMTLNLPDSDEEEEEEEGDDDVEESDDDDDDDDSSDQEMKLPDEKSWGKKKGSYYSADIAEGEVGSDEEALELEREEEVEALALQKRLAAGLDEEDFDTAGFQIPEADDIEEQSNDIDEVKKTVITDLTKLSKEQKLEMLFRDSPELFELLDEFKEKLNELSCKISPLLQLSESGNLPAEGSTYVELKYKLYLNYCVNIGFYLVLKAKQTPVKNHPVIERIVQYRNLIKELVPLDKKLESDVAVLLANKEKLMGTINDKKEQILCGKGKSAKTKATKAIKKKHMKDLTPKPKLSTLLDDSDADVEDQKAEPPSKKIKKAAPSEDTNVDPLEYYEKVRQQKKKLKKMKDLAARLAHEPELELEDTDENEDIKRAITYQISKNKGLTAKKKKEDRNPRVKHRKKYSKAVIKRKSQVRPVTNEETRYDGEKSGIRAFLTRSVKIK